MDDLTKALVRAVRAAPCSIRALCREAGVDPSNVAKILRGDLGASPEVAGALAGALQRWGQRCVDQAKAVRRALPRTERSTRKPGRRTR